MNSKYVFTRAIMLKKHFITTVLIFVTSKLISAQDTLITKNDMYGDFDYLVNIIEQTNPYLEIKKRYCNYSIMDSIKSYRSEIENCNNYSDFYMLTNKIMNTCIDGHSAVLTPATKWPTVNLYIPLVYQYGNYIIQRDFVYNSLEFTAGAKLTAINGNKNIHEEIAKQIPSRYLMRWDNQFNIFYSEIFFWSNNYIAEEKIELEFDDTLLTTFNFKDEIKLRTSPSTDSKRVEYFEQSKILYVRIPSMNWSDRNYFKNEIIKKGRGKEIEKVVIDVRKNMGGSSIVGRNVIKSILPNPIFIRTRWYGNSPIYVSKSYKRNHGIDKVILKEPIKELDSIQMFHYMDKLEKIKPFNSSIRHEGDIFILGNENVYSAGGAIFMFSNYSDTDKIFSIGTPTGWFLGEFSDPIQYTLPNTKIKFQISPTMSMTCVKNWSNVMLDSYDYIIYPSIEDYKYFYAPRSILYSEDYLMQYDPYFKPIINVHK